MGQKSWSGTHNERNKTHINIDLELILALFLNHSLVLCCFNAVIKFGIRKNFGFGFKISYKRTLMS